jgi:hypothetical protein
MRRGSRAIKHTLLTFNIFFAEVSEGQLGTVKTGLPGLLYRDGNAQIV